jgi:type VI protein secretion system component VasK
MKQQLHRPNNHGAKNELVLAAVFLIGSALIWFVGPYLNAAHHAPLHSSHRKITAIALLGAVLLARFLSMRRKKNSPDLVSGPRRLNFSVLIGAVYKWLDRVRGGGPSDPKKIQLHNLPWYLVIGPEGSGKTALMANSQINFTAEDQIAPESLAALKNEGNYSLWLLPDAVLLDVPGSYLSEMPDRQWLALFNKKQRRKNTVGAIIITLSLADLTHQDTRAHVAANLRARIQELKELFGAAIPFYFTLTKCDLMPGFLNFFAQSGTDELGQAWGVSIPPLPSSVSLIDTFTNRFNALIKRLNKQLIWRLHQERGTFERVFIKDFPLQIERLKEMLISFLTSLTQAGNPFALQGLYLTSAMQTSADQPTAGMQMLNTLENTAALQIMKTPVMPNRSYFIRQFLLQGLHSDFNPLPAAWQRPTFIYGLCASAFLMTIAFLGYDMFYSKDKMLAMQDVVVPTFNIVVPQDQPKETQVGDITILG